MVAAAVIGSAALSAGVGAAASKSAANTQAGAANQATALQAGMYDQSQRNIAPWFGIGNWANQNIQANIQNGGYGGTFTAQDYLSNQDPGYGFQLAQGQQALQNSQAAGSGVLSGAALKGLIGYNQGMASTGYQNAYNRWLSSQQNSYNQLMGLSQLGQNAAVGAGNTGAQYAQGMSGTITGAGNAQAAGTVGAANALSSGISSGTGYYALSNMLGNSGASNYGSGFNGQNNPAN